MSPDSTAAPKDLIGFLDYYLVQKAPFQIPQAAESGSSSTGRGSPSCSSS